MSALIEKLGEFTDSLTGVQGSLGYLAIILAIVLGYRWASASMFPEHPTGADISEEIDEPDPPRNFTLQQLANFDGTKDDKSEEAKPVYLSVNGIVFDVSTGRDFYGPGGPYEKFAGHECGVALAKMAFDEEFLDDLKGCGKLNFGERTELENWIEKFRDYRCYPVLGRLVVDLDPDRVMTTADLTEHDGSGEIPEGYGAAPIYIGADNRVFDMSFGGASFYGPGGPYNKFSGRDASRALALMSLDPADLDNTSITDCTEKQIKTMHDWIKTFSERKKYPVVGRLEK